MKYGIVEHSLETEKFKIGFEYKIADVKYWDEIFVVLLSIPNKVDEIDNIYGVSVDGDIIWRIENPIKAFKITIQEQGYSYYRMSVYVDIQLNRGVFTGTTFFGVKYTFNHKTGKLLTKKVGRW